MKSIKYAILILVVVLVAGCNSSVQQKNQSTVSVIGTGTVSVNPDMVQMSISLSKTAQTTQLAQEEISRMTRQALEILKSMNIEDKDISTASLTFNPEYDYSSNRRILIGQRGEQSITFSIHDIQTDNEKASKIIDMLVRINGIELNGMNFSVKNNTEHFIKSRELAFRKAEEKAKQYAELSGLKVVKILSISEEGNQQLMPVNNRMMFGAVQEMSVAKDVSDSTVLPSGEMEITTRIAAVFILE
ncbi:MAG: SIMPL domain-containing protein [Bacteroidales bacterium]|jgi:uncharacterized protein YggE|nr:SIMPL domain-containing protein [Bacteroidales bacterium]